MASRKSKVFIHLIFWYPALATATISHQKLPITQCNTRLNPAQANHRILPKAEGIPLTEHTHNLHVRPQNLLLHLLLLSKTWSSQDSTCFPQTTLEHSGT